MEKANIPWIDKAFLKDYVVARNEGPDFVYYTALNADKAKLTFYIGGHPNLQHENFNNVNVIKETAKIHGEDGVWYVWQAEGIYYREALLRDFPDCPVKIHIIISGKDLDQVNMLKNAVDNCSLDS